jgi:DNA (cytosine-5)-methyltransferase 1
MKYGSVCSGVEAATVAWHPLGWQPQWFSEIEKFPSAVLEHHYPDVPNLGDMTKFKEWSDDPIDLLVGGTPCQSFSVAGLRKGLDDPRGNLMLTYLAIAERYQPRWLVWENVPGVLSSNRGRDFGTFLGALGQIGYGFAYRVLDAQYFGVAQRRRRVFVVGYLGDWRRAAAVLFERESLSGHPAPSRETREEVAGYTSSSFEKYSEGVGTVRAAGGDLGGGSETLLAFGAQNSARQGDSVSEHVTPTLDKSKTPAVMSGPSVRRLTPRECERLQGFPDNYTLIPYRNKLAADGPRYKAMGNSMAVPVMHWIGKQIQMVEDMK